MIPWRSLTRHGRTGHVQAVVCCDGGTPLSMWCCYARRGAAATSRCSSSATGCSWPLQTGAKTVAQAHGLAHGKIERRAVGDEMARNKWMVYGLSLAAKLVIAYVGNNDPRIFLLMAITTVFDAVPLILDWHEETKKTGIMSPEEFGQRWRSLVVPTASLMMVASIGVGCICAALLCDLLGLTGTQMPAFYFTFSAWGAPSIFMIGRWMGRRSSLENTRAKKDAFWAYAMGVAVPAVVLLITQLVKGLHEVIFVFVFVIVFLILTPYGYNFGRKQVHGAYMEYLTNKLPLGEQKALADMVYRGTQAQRDVDVTGVAGTDDNHAHSVGGVREN